MGYVTREEAIRRGILTPRGGRTRSQRTSDATSNVRWDTRKGRFVRKPIPEGVKKKAGGRTLISLGGEEGKQLWVTEDMGTYLYSYPGTSGQLYTGGFDLSIPAGKAAAQKARKRQRLANERMRESIWAQERKQRLQQEKTFAKQVDMLRSDWNKQFGETISGLTKRRWSPRVAGAKQAQAKELKQMQKKLSGLSREEWLKEAERMSSEDTSFREFNRRVPRTSFDPLRVSGTGRRLSGRK